MLEIYPAARLRVISLDMLQHAFDWEIGNIIEKEGSAAIMMTKARSYLYADQH